VLRDRPRGTLATNGPTNYTNRVEIRYCMYVRRDYLTVTTICLGNVLGAFGSFRPKWA
jgi:hypothetical protein